VFLFQEYKEGETKLDDALDLSIKVLSKTLDMNKLTPDKIEIATLRRIDGKTVISIMVQISRNLIYFFTDLAAK
jgi:20S proteasome subunit alpha 3